MQVVALLNVTGVFKEKYLLACLIKSGTVISQTVKKPFWIISVSVNILYISLIENSPNIHYRNYSK